MSNKRPSATRGVDSRKRTHLSLVAHKLIAVEAEWRREKSSLLREIKRLRSEVNLMTKQYNNSQREVKDMVRRLKAQPPPPIPKRPTDRNYGKSTIAGDDRKAWEGHGGEAGRYERAHLMPLYQTNPRSIIPTPTPTKPAAPLNSEIGSDTCTSIHTRSDHFVSERLKKFTQNVEKRAELWDRMAEGFFAMIDEKEGQLEGRGYERYDGNEEWDQRIVRWARKKRGRELTGFDKKCWKAQYLVGYRFEVEIVKGGVRYELVRDV